MRFTTWTLLAVTLSCRIRIIELGSEMPQKARKSVFELLNDLWVEVGIDGSCWCREGSISQRPQPCQRHLFFKRIHHWLSMPIANSRSSAFRPLNQIEAICA